MKISALGSVFFQKGANRSIAIKTNLLFSVILKGASVAISFLVVPITLHLLNKENYGVWLTISSFISWFSLFDIGLGNGLRNRFAEANARNDIALCKIYVSTTFALIAVIIAAVFVIFVIIQPLVSWSRLFNVPAAREGELASLVIVVFSFFCLQFIFKQTTVILMADQKSAMSDLANVAGSALSLACIAVLTHFSSLASLTLLGTIFSACPAIVLMASYFLMFKGRYKVFKPQLSSVQFKYSKDLLGLGFKFFIAQVAALVVFSTSNIVISHLLSPSQVTTYNIGFKYFSLITFGFQIILTPFWAAFTDAYVKNDTMWIKRSIKSLVLIWGASCLFAAIMVAISGWVYTYWVGRDADVPAALSLSFAVYVCIGNWNNIFTCFNLGTSKLRLQVYLSVVAGLINIPLTIFFIKLVGLPGDVIGMILAIIPGTFLSPLQYVKIINGTAKGIWNK